MAAAFRHRVLLGNGNELCVSDVESVNLTRSVRIEVSSCDHIHFVERGLVVEVGKLLIGRRSPVLKR